MFLERTPLAFPVGRGIVGDEDTLADAVPDLYDLPGRSYFINLCAGRIVLLNLRSLRFNQTVEA